MARMYGIPSSGSRRPIILAKALVSCALLVVLAWRVDLREVRAQLTSVALWPLSLSILVFAASILAQGGRWRLLLAARKVELRFVAILRLILGGGFLNLFLPGNLGGDVYRIYGARKAAASLLQSTGIVLLERYCGFLAAFLVAIPALAFSDFGARQREWTIVFLLLFLLFLLLIPLAGSRGAAKAVETIFRRMRLEKLAELIPRASTAMRSSTSRLLLQVILLSLSMKLCAAVILYLLAVSLGLEIRWADLLVFLPIHSVVSALPIAINGLGVREANLTTFFTQMGMAPEQAASLAFLHLIWLYATALPGGAVLLFKPLGPRSSRDVSEIS